jgi:hypothetical protein
MEVASLSRMDHSTASTERPRQSEAAQNSAQPSSPPAATDNRFDSPVVNFDSATGAAILQFRNGATGEQEFQIPSKTTLQYQQSQELATAHKVDGEKKDTVA